MTLLEEWGLTADGPLRSTDHAEVVAVRTAGGRPAVLKVAHRAESALEHVALKQWDGRGAVGLLRADPHRRALLLERLHAEDLTDHWDVEACEVVGGLYATLHVPAPPQLPALSSYVERWTADLAALPSSAPVPHRMVQQAVAIGRALAADEATDGTTVHGDLHYANVLASDGEPWVAISPKPLSGDPHYEVAPLLLHRYDELHSDVRRGLRARFHAVIDVAGLDEDRARDWVVLRMLWHARQQPADLTRCVSIAKAVQE